jgi:pyridoxamine 5'-phosphate oxidase-like protein
VSAIPSQAGGILTRSTICYLAVRSRWGPHLTPVVHVLDGGRVWVTTARGSVKARRWRDDPEVAGLAADGEAWVSFRGLARTYDALDPFSWPGAVLAGPRLVEAAARFTMKNARFFAGYAVDARKVPLAWTPPGRVFASIRPLAGRGGVGDRLDPHVGWGPWPAGSRYHRTFAPPAAGPTGPRVPKAVRAAVGDSGAGVLTLDGDAGLTVVPVTWRRNAREGSYEATVPAEILDLAAAGPDARAALTVDRASRWRAAEMTGMLLQGSASLYSPAITRRGAVALRDRLGDDRELALVRLRPDRAVWWEGWTTGAATAGPRARVASGGAA